MDNVPQTRVGKVARISNSGNAIVENSTKLDSPVGSQLNQIVNLGPLPHSIVNKEVRFILVYNGWGLCIEPRFLNSKYIESRLGKLTQGQRDTFKQYSGVNSVIQSVVPNHVNSGDVLFADPLTLDSGDNPSADNDENRPLVKLSSKNNEDLGCIGVVEPLIAQNEASVPVLVTGVQNKCVELTRRSPAMEDELPAIGETVVADVESRANSGNIASYESGCPIPVLLDYYQDSSEAHAVRITGIEKTHLVGEVASRSNIETIHVSDSEITQTKRQSRYQVSTQEATVNIKPAPPGASSTTRAIITDESREALIGRWDIQREINPIRVEKGDKIEVEIGYISEQSCIGYHKNFPVSVNLSSKIGSQIKGKTLSVTVQSIYPDRAVAKPVWITDAQTTFTVQVVGTTENDAIGITDGSMVRIPNASVISSGEEVLVSLEDPTDSDSVAASVSARPMLQEGGGPHLVRLPHTQGDVVNLNGTPILVEHLPDLDKPVTLGIAETNTDHILPSITSLPESHLPTEGSHISVDTQIELDKTTTAVGEELPVELGPFITSTEDSTTVQVLELNPNSLFGFSQMLDDNAGSHLRQAYQKLQSAGFDLQQRDCQNAAKHLTQAAELCSEDYPVVEKLITTQRELVRTVTAIQDGNGSAKVTHTLSEEASSLREFNRSRVSNNETSALLSAHRAEIQAAEKFLNSLSEMSSGTESSLQEIAQGVSTKDQAIEATEKLILANNTVPDTLNENKIPSLGMQAVVHEFQEAFPGVIGEIQAFGFSDDGSDWFRYLVSDIMIARTDASLANIESNTVWRRPNVPESTGVVSVSAMDVTDGTTSEPSPKDETVDKPQEQVNQEKPEDSDSSTTEPVQADSSSSKHTTTGESSSSGLNRTPEDTEEEVQKQASTADATRGKQTPEIEESASLRKLRKQAEAEATENPAREDTEKTTSRYQRSPAIREYALERADGECELCGKEAPFVKSNGEPYLEVHHVNELGEGGADHPSLVAAVCPACHKEIHYGRHGDTLNEELRARLESGLGDVGAVDN